MANYTQYGKNTIFCAPAQMLEQPIRKESPVAGEYLPGTVVHLDENGNFSAGKGSVSYVLDRDHLGQEPVTQAYATNDRATSFYAKKGLFLNVRAELSQTITEDAPLFVTGTGTLTLDGPTVDDGEGGTMPDPSVKPFCYAAETITTSAGNDLVTAKFI